MGVEGVFPLLDVTGVPLAQPARSSKVAAVAIVFRMSVSPLNDFWVVAAGMAYCCPTLPL